MQDNRPDPYHRYIQRLYNIGTIDKEALDRDLGRYYGYPLCCIDFFIDMGEKYPGRVGERAGMIYGEDILDIDYVRCPNCRAK